MARCVAVARRGRWLRRGEWPCATAYVSGRRLRFAPRLVERDRSLLGGRDRQEQCGGCDQEPRPKRPLRSARGTLLVSEVVSHDARLADQARIRFRKMRCIVEEACSGGLAL